MSAKITAFLDSYRNRLPGPATEWDERVGRALNCIHSYLFKEKLNVSWMKQQCHINGHNFASRFRYYVGMSPKEYINHHRIEAAKQLLLFDEVISLADIAYAVGFSGQASFTNTFKHLTRITPGKWRNYKGK